MTRYRDITLAEMTPEQRRAHDLIVAGRRGQFGGPFQLLIRSPAVCEHAAKLGEHLRWGTSLAARLSELAIITTARFWRAQRPFRSPDSRQISAVPEKEYGSAGVASV